MHRFLTAAWLPLLTIAFLLMPLMHAQASEIDRSRHKSGAVLMLLHQHNIRGNLSSAYVKVGTESGSIIFDDQLSGTLNSAHCIISIKAHGKDYDDGWTVKATAKGVAQPCSGVPDGVYLTYGAPR